MFLKVNILVTLLLSSTTTVDGFTARSPSFLNNAPTKYVAGNFHKSSSLAMMDPFLSTSQLLSDAADAVADAASTVSDAVATAAGAGADTAATAAAAADATTTASNTGGLGFLTAPIESLLNLIHTAFVAVGLDANAWGISIVMLTVLIKVVTYPLTKTQLESSVKMQAVQPLVKEIQAKYASNQEVMNQKVAEIYQQNDVNPLAGCLPAFIQIPVFVGLYRAVLNLASENALDEPFLWLPSLEGPTYGAALGKGNDWLLGGLTANGAPALGWEDTAAFLSIPIILIITQILSIELNKKGQTPEQLAQTDNIVFKLLPLFLGWVSVGVPSALGVYWISNNIITTAITLQVRSSVDANPPTIGATAGSGGAAMSTPASTFTPAPMREKPAGFASPSSSDPDAVSPITATAIDAEVVAAEEVEAATGTEEAGSVPAPSKKKRGKKRKRKN